MQEGGKRENPEALTSVSGSGYWVQPTNLQFER
jgi:hypothetical protein